MGIDVTRYTALTSGVGAAYAGVAGALAALLLDFIAPESFTYWLSILFLVGSVFGGMTSVWSVVAGTVLQFWPDIARMVSRDLVHPVFGALLVLTMRFMPNGVAGRCRCGDGWEHGPRGRGFDQNRSGPRQGPSDFSGR